MLSRNQYSNVDAAVTLTSYDYNDASEWDNDISKDYFGNILTTQFQKNISIDGSEWAA